MTPSTDFIAVIFMTGIMAAAVFSDLRSRRIPNRLIYPSMVFLLAYFSMAHGFSGFVFSAQGLLLGTGLLLPVYVLGGMGAGDAKLMGAAGAALGAAGVFTAFLFTALAGGIYALGTVVFQRRTAKALFARIGLMLKNFLYTRRFVYIPEEKQEQASRLCYAIPIAIGTAGALAWHLAYRSYLI